MAEEAKVTLTILARNLAQKELESFRQSLRGLGKEAQDMLGSKLTQALSLGAIFVGLKKAFDATDELEQSQRTLAATAQITGTNLQELYDISNNLRNAFQLDDDMSNQFTETITRLTTQAGAFNQTQQAAAAFLELGAARGMTAKETMESLENAFVGVYRGAQRLIGVNVQDLFERQARAMGLNVSQLTEGEKAHILLTAAINAGETARGSYEAWLETAAGRQQLFNLRLNDAQVRLGRALAPVRLLAIQGFAFLAEKVEAFIGGIQLLAAEARGFFDNLGAVNLRARAWMFDLLADIQETISKSFPGLANLLFDLDPEQMRHMATIWRNQAAEIAKDAADTVDRKTKETIAEHNVAPTPTGTEPPKGSANAPPGAPDTRQVIALQQNMTRLKAAFQEGMISAIGFAGGMDAIRTIAQKAQDTPGLSPEAWQQLQGVIDNATSAIHGAADGLNDLIDTQNASEEAWNKLINVTVKWKDILSDAANNTLTEFAGVIEETFSAIVDHSVSAGEALKVGMLRAIAAIIRGIGQMLLVQAGQWIAEGIANPFIAGIKFAAAAKAAGVAAIAFALAGALGGAANNTVGTGGGGGGGGGGSPAVAQTARENAVQKTGTLVIEGGILDMTDPHQRDALAEAFRTLGSLNRIDVIVRP